VRPIEDVHRAIEAGELHGSASLDEAIRRADETLAVLRVRFPGPIRADLAAGWQSTPAWRFGPLLALAVALGKRAVPLLVELLSSHDHNRRAWAALVCRDVRHPQLVYPLFALVFDPEPGVRDVAIGALDSYPRREIGDALEQLRNALYGEPARAQAAAYAIGCLGDAHAVSGLIAATARDATTAEAARRVLVGMTGQDFGTKTKKWLAWWHKNQTRPQVAWLLDGLAHDDEAVRRSSIKGLSRLIGETFGYRADLPKQERVAARGRWLAWWDAVGRHAAAEGGAAPTSERPPSSIPRPPADPRPRKPG
jgi:HEAT repeat protein